MDSVLVVLDNLKATEEEVTNKLEHCDLLCLIFLINVSVWMICWYTFATLYVTGLKLHSVNVLGAVLCDITL